MDNPEQPEKEIQAFVMEAIVKAVRSADKSGAITLDFNELLSELGMDMTSSLPEQYLERIADALHNLKDRGYNIEEGDKDGVFTITFPESLSG